MKIIFIALQLSQPRCIKRIKAIYNAGFDIKVYGFDSGMYNESLKTLPFPVERIIERDKNESRYSKVYHFRSHLKQIFKENAKSDLYYLFGFEIASMAWFLGCRNYVYEEADVTASREKRTIIKKSLIWLDRQIIKRSRITVFTSQGFSDYLFGDKALSKIIHQPNKLNNDFFDERLRASLTHLPLNMNNIKFGFVGLIRYPNTIMRFAKVIGKYYPQHEFHFYGTLDRPDYWDAELDSYKNVVNHGPFKNPVDQPRIYSEFNISVVCYDTSSENVRIAEPNKLYESIFFETPIVVSSNTYLEKRVEELGVGYSIDASKDRIICSFIDGLNEKSLSQIRQRMRNVSLAELIDNPNILIERLKKLD